MDRETRLETNRSGFWEIRWTEADAEGRGRTRSRSTGTKDKRIAEEVRRGFVRQEKENTARAGETLVGALLDGYEATAAARGVGKTQRVCVRRLRYFNAFTPGELTPEAILDYAKARGVSDATLRRELKALVAALEWAAKHGKISRPTKPVIELPPDGEARTDFWDEKAEHELFELAARDVGPDGRLSRIGRFVTIGLDTGARHAALLGLTWNRVDLVRGTVDFRDPTLPVTKKRRIVTLIPTRLMAVLKRASAERKPGARYVLDDLSSLRRSWDTFMARHKFVDKTPHVMRHTRITLLLRAGVSVWDVSGLVGASSDIIQKVYGHHVADDRLRALADRRAS